MRRVYDIDICTTHLCKLDDGTIVPYDAAADTEEAYNPAFFRCIGRGIIESIDGTKQNDDRKYYFFARQ